MSTWETTEAVIAVKSWPPAESHRHTRAMGRGGEGRGGEGRGGQGRAGQGRAGQGRGELTL